MARKKSAPAEPTGPRSYTTDDVVVEVEGGEKRTLNGWLGSGEEARTVRVSDLDGNDFEFDDPTGIPADVVVYVDGRPDAAEPDETPAEPAPEEPTP